MTNDSIDTLRCCIHQKQIETMNEYTKDYSRREFVEMLVSQREEIENLLAKIRSANKYMKNKIQASFNYERGLSGNFQDRLFPETVVEFQIVMERLKKVKK